METSAKPDWIHIIKVMLSYTHNLTFISPYILGMLIFVFIYVRLCSNDSNLDGDVYFEQGEYTKALECYEEYLMLYPHHIKTIYNRGRCYDELGDRYRASIDYEAVLDRDRDNIKALVSLSQYYYHLENYEAAANLSGHATLLDEENYLAHYHKARACHKIGDVPDAIESYNAVIDLKPDFGFAYYQRASLLISIGLRPFGCYDLQVAANLNVEGAHEAIVKYCR